MFRLFFIGNGDKHRSDLYGKKCEGMACRYLKRKGYRILRRNYLCPVGEIDIIAKKGNYLVFVEVKARKDERFGYGRETINAEKKRKIISASEFYMKCYIEKQLIIRYDLIDIMGENLEHFEAIF